MSNLVANRIMKDYYKKKINRIRDNVYIAIEKYGKDKTDIAISLYGNNFYNRLVECDENHIQDECELCRI